MDRNMFVTFLLGLAISLLSCSVSQDTNSQEEENQELIKMLSRINEIANSAKCVNADEWRFTSYGSKPCGGPYGYIAYSTAIDTTHFLALVTEHESAEKVYNEKWGLQSDCSIPAEPSGVICENDRPVLVYP
ncbi:hypothetical protein [Sediminicola sp. 1XM1-17]|uniref:hypothetical protein n=1 Tax=Sediminicola sp. 1XM1-17 TaxID=3127702 RepID=UPI003076993B